MQFDAVQLTRFLVAAEAVDQPVTVVLNKVDLVEPLEVERRVTQVSARSHVRCQHRHMARLAGTIEDLHCLAGTIEDLPWSCSTR